MRIEMMPTRMQKRRTVVAFLLRVTQALAASRRMQSTKGCADVFCFDDLQYNTDNKSGRAPCVFNHRAALLLNKMYCAVYIFFYGDDVYC
jgi:hypothetical protein